MLDEKSQERENLKNGPDGVLFGGLSALESHHDLRAELCAECEVSAKRAD